MNYKMTYEEIKNILVNNAVIAIRNSCGQLLYSDKTAARYGEIDADEFTLATFFLVDTVIAHNVPLWKNGK
jgi:hypothetical protein